MELKVEIVKFLVFQDAPHVLMTGILVNTETGQVICASKETLLGLGDAMHISITVPREGIEDVS